MLWLQCESDCTESHYTQFPALTVSEGRNTVCLLYRDTCVAKVTFYKVHHMAHMIYSLVILGTFASRFLLTFVTSDISGPECLIT